MQGIGLDRLNSLHDIDVRIDEVLLDLEGRL